MNRINKKITKFIFITIIFLTIFIISSNLLTAFATDQINPTNPTNNSFSKAMKVTIGVFEVVTVGVAVIMLISLAIRYMVSAPNEKAEIKKHAVVYVVGAFIAFGATGIIELFKKFTEEALK